MRRTIVVSGFLIAICMAGTAALAESGQRPNAALRKPATDAAEVVASNSSEAAQAAQW